MSKASEWKRVAGTRPIYRDTPPRGDAIAVSANVTDNGSCYVYMGGAISPITMTLPPEQALKLARWILDTFGDDK